MRDFTAMRAAAGPVHGLRMYGEITVSTGRSIPVTVAGRLGTSGTTGDGDWRRHPDQRGSDVVARGSWARRAQTGPRDAVASGSHGAFPGTLQRASAWAALCRRSPEKANVHFPGIPPASGRWRHACRPMGGWGVTSAPRCRSRGCWPRFPWRGHCLGARRPIPSVPPFPGWRRCSPRPGRRCGGSRTCPPQGPCGRVP